MADVAVVRQEVGLSDDVQGLQTQRVQFGEAVNQGQTVYLKSSDNKYWLADASVGSAEADVKGIAITHGDADGYGIIVTGGELNFGSAILTKGTQYVLSPNNAGGVAPLADLSAGNYLSGLGFAISTSVLSINLDPTGKHYDPDHDWGRVSSHDPDTYEGGFS